MTDRYIDLDETQIYGPYAVRKIRKKVVGIIPELDPALVYVANHLEVSTLQVGALIASAREAEADIRKGVKKKTPVLARASDLLARFSKHLDAHPAGTIDRKVYFTADGTASGIPKSAHKVLLAITHIANELGKRTAEVRERETWRNEFVEMMNELAPAIEHADDARTDRRGITPEAESARKAWLVAYMAAKSQVETVLRLTGKLGKMSVVFHDLAVPAKTRVTVIPDDDEGLEDER